GAVHDSGWCEDRSDRMRRRLWLEISVGRGLHGAAGMYDSAARSRSDRLRVAPQRPARVIGTARLPTTTALFQHLGRHDQIDGPGIRVDGDDVSILDQSDRPDDSGFGTKVADTQSARSTGEASIGDQGYFLAHALTVDCRGGGEHLAHARPAPW